MHSYVDQTPTKPGSPVIGIDDIRRKIRVHIIDSLLLGDSEDFADDTSLLEAGILDSTGAMELVAFLEETFAIKVADQEIIPDNLDSVDRLSALIERKLA